MVGVRGLPAATLLLVLLAAAPGASADPSPSAFPKARSDFFLTGQEADGPTVAGDTAPLLLETEPGAAGAAQLLPVLQVLNLGQNSQSWYSDEPWAFSRQLVTDPVATIHVQANVQATASFTVSLSAVSPDGQPILLGRDSFTFNLPTLLPRAEVFLVPAAGSTIPAGHVLRFTVTLDDIDVVTILQYGAGNPSGLVLETRILDSDGDGVPDDTDACPLDADCDDDGTDDGGEDSDGDGLGDSFEYTYYNTTHVHNGDSDGDGVPDGAEDDDGDGVTNHYEYVYNTDPHDPDSDGDGIPDGDEIDGGTDPADPDTDGDGLPDGQDPTPGEGPGPGPGAGGDGQGGGRLEGHVEPMVGAGAFAGTSALAILLLLRRF